MDWIDAVILGIVEGLTEFLPISSTGHLIVVGDVLGVVSPEGHLFEIAIQLGAILAVCALYRATLVRTAWGMWRAGREQRFVRNILLAFLPAAMLGVLFHDVITELLFSPRVVAIMLLMGGIAILLIERYNHYGLVAAWLRS
jgi:undecaprenyl-diphosphatase